MSTRIYDSARKFADAEGLDLEPILEAGDLEGTGSGGAVTKQDVLTYLDARAHEDADEGAVDELETPVDVTDAAAELGAMAGLSVKDVGRRV